MIPRPVTCTACPCLNQTFDDDYTCNLRYIVYVVKKPIFRVVSDGCGLEAVTFEGGEYRPVERNAPETS